LAALSSATLAWSLPLTFGYLVAIPFAVLTASEDVAELLKRHALCGIPEELEPPAEIRALQG
jgi:membrane glycosyltransferase